MVNMPTPRQHHRTPAGQHRAKVSLLEKAETPLASEVLMKTVKDFQKGDIMKLKLSPLPQATHNKRAPGSVCLFNHHTSYNHFLSTYCFDHLNVLFNLVLQRRISVTITAVFSISLVVSG